MAFCSRDPDRPDSGHLQMTASGTSETVEFRRLLSLTASQKISIQVL